jgi:hypothetical protein
MKVIRPFDSLVDVDDFAEFDEAKQLWRVKKDIWIRFPVEPVLNNVDCEYWESFPGSLINFPRILVMAGYEWDGASGPAMDTPDIRLASMVHDIICTVVRGERVVGGYFARHWLYYVIARTQGCPKARASYHLVALLLFNWLHELRAKRKKGEDK